MARERLGLLQVRMVRDPVHRDPARPQEGEAVGLVVGLQAKRAVGALDVEHRARDAAPEEARANAREGNRTGRLVQRVELPFASAGRGPAAVRRRA